MVMWLVDRGVTNVVAVDLAQERLDRATALGAAAVINASREDVRARLFDLHGSGPGLSGDQAGTDVFMDAAGGSNVINDIIRMGKRHARLVVRAAYAGPVAIDMTAALVNEMTITSAIGYPDEMPVVIAALPRLHDKVQSLISHRFGLDDVLQALKIAGTPQSTKVMINCEAV
jgi:threonine dehydrogenase-like Zn-dependent dehydrogenase